MKQTSCLLITKPTITKVYVGRVKMCNTPMREKGYKQLKGGGGEAGIWNWDP